MTLKDDVQEAVVSVWDSRPSADELVSVVWAVLEDKVGAVQEQLLAQVTMLRTELEASRRREAFLTETIQGLHLALDSVSSKTSVDTGE